MMAATPVDVLSGDAQWCVVHADLHDVLPTLPDDSVDHVITDPPYSEQVHKSVRSAKRSTMPDTADFSCRTRRVVDLGFERLDDNTRSFVAEQTARLCKRWALFFSDVESAHFWREAMVACGHKYKRTGAWHRIGGAPQFTGDRPASGFEAITMTHPPGRSKWNGGGHAAIYSHPIVANRLGQRGSRVHPTQKPLSLMMELVSLFADPGDIILDPFAGSGTTGAAALRLGRRIILVERDEEHATTARDRMIAEGSGNDIASHRAGQTSLFAKESA